MFMLNPRWRKILRDLWNNKTRTILVSLSIAVGIFAVGTIAHTYITVSQELTAIYSVSNPANATLYTDLFDDELVRVIQHMPNVQDAEPRSMRVLRLKTGPEQWHPMQVFAIPDYENIRIDKIWPEYEFDAAPNFGAARTEWPPPERAVLFERASLLMPGLVPPNVQVGDNITVETPTGERRELRVAGLAHEPIRVPATFANMAYGYVTFETMEWLGGSRRYNQLNIVVAGDKYDKKHITRVAEEVADKVEKSGRTVYATQVPEPGKRPFVDDIFQGSLLLLGVLGFLSLFLSGFLVINTISALLAQQVRQIGMMKAIGARKGQIIALYLGMVIVFGVLALLVAAPLSALVASQTAQLMAGFINVNFPAFSIPPIVIALEVIIGIVVPLLAALVPVISGTRITVHEAISSYGISGDFGQGIIDRLLERVRGLSRPMLLSLRNTFRRKARLLLTLLTLVLSGTMFVSVASVRTSLDLTLDEAIKYWQYDVEVNFNRAYRVEEIENVARRVPGVEAVESWGFASVRRVRADDSESDSLIVVAPPAETEMLQPTIIAGRWLLPEDENAVVVSNNVLKVEPDIAVGDEIILNLDNRETKWVVVGTVRVVGGGNFVYANYPYFSRVARRVDQAGSVRVVTAQHDAAYQAEVARALEQQFESAGLHVNSTQTLAEMRQANEFYFSIIVTLLLVMAVLMAAVGGLGLMGTMSMNVLERTREIGVMRAIGASNGAVRRIVMVEGVLIGVISWLLGATLAVLLAKVLSDAVGQTFFQIPLSYRYSFGGVVIWLVIVLILSSLASLLPARAAARLTVREILAYE